MKAFRICACSNLIRTGANSTSRITQITQGGLEAMVFRPRSLLYLPYILR
jgi:hypothetical protein